MSGLLNQLHLSNKHAHFYAHITVHEVQNIPLLSGDFAVAWRVQHTVSASRRVTPTPSTPSALSMEEGSGRESPHSAPPTQRFVAPAPASVPTLARAPPSPVTSRLGDGRASPRSPAPSLPDTNGEDERCNSRRPPSQRARVRTHRSGSLQAWIIPPNVPHKVANGNTSFMPINEQHAVIWEHKVETMLRIPIGRTGSATNEPSAGDTDSVRSMREVDSARSVREGAGRLRPTVMRLRVLQRHSRDEPQSGDNSTRFGLVEIDLAEYAPVPGSGSRTESRQYLLQKSTTNALLRLTVELRLVDTTHIYTVPMIRSGMIDPSIRASDRLARTTALEEQNETDAFSPPDTNVGLEWQYKLPVSIMFRKTAIPDHFLNECLHADPHENGAYPTHRTSIDASEPRLLSCEVNTVEVMDDLFGGRLGPTVDQRASEESDAPRDAPSKNASTRWRHLIRSVMHDSSRRHTPGEQKQRLPRLVKGEHALLRRAVSGQSPGRLSPPTRSDRRTWLLFTTRRSDSGDTVLGSGESLPSSTGSVASTGPGSAPSSTPTSPVLSPEPGSLPTSRLSQAFPFTPAASTPAPSVLSPHNCLQRPQGLAIVTESLGGGKNDDAHAPFCESPSSRSRIGHDTSGAEVDSDRAPAHDPPSGDHDGLQTGSPRLGPSDTFSGSAMPRALSDHSFMLHSPRFCTGDTQVDRHSAHGAARDLSPRTSNCLPGERVRSFADT